MFCKNCGNPVNDKAALCVQCGCNPTEGDQFCENCGAKVIKDAIKCENCNNMIVSEFHFMTGIITAAGTKEYKIDNMDFTQPLPSGQKAKMKTLSPFYQNEFQKIYQSKEAYKGRFNIFGFLFGPVWAMTKDGCSLYGTIGFIICMITAGLAVIPCAIIFGLRGTFWHYGGCMAQYRKMVWNKVKTGAMNQNEIKWHLELRNL